MSGLEDRTARIIICEDERIVALDLRAFLQRNGYEVPSLFASAEDLLESVEALEPDLVLMDIHLQGAMDGIEAAAILLERWAIPVILLTAYADGPTIERAKLTHPYAYILKPYDERELRTAISIGLYRASMEKRLRTSEERYRGLFEHGLAATMLAEPGGRVLEANNAFAALAPDAGNAQDILADPVDAERLVAAMEKGDSYGPVEVRIKRADGAEAWVLLSAAPMRLSDGTAAYQFQAVDITERKSLADQLLHAQKLSALGRFAGGVAHDFNNVLTAVMGYSRLLRSDLEEEGHPLEELDGIDQAAKRAAALARQLLLFSRREDMKLAVFSLSELAREDERMLRRIIGEGASLVIRALADDDLVRVDRARVEQAVVNLIANARNVTDRGGRIYLATGTVRYDEPVMGAIEPVPAGDWSYIEVVDEGPGIPPELLDKVFQPFFTTKPADRGTGLGLSTVAGIVRQAEGRIALVSKPGAGTTMRLLFPRVQGGQPREEAGAHDRGAVRARHGSLPAGAYRPRILLVEHDDSVRAILEALMERAGYAVFSATHPGEALLIAENMANGPDLLVADDELPLMGGVELAGRLRAGGRAVPALYLRAADGNHEDRPAVDSATGAEAFLDKPFTEDELMDAMEGLLPRRS